MRDPLDDRLSALGEGDPLPLAPAAAVRARGDQRRARTRAALGSGLAAVVVLAGGAVALGGGTDRLDPAPPATSPTASRAPSFDTRLLPAPTDVGEALGSPRQWIQGVFEGVVDDAVQQRRPCVEGPHAVTGSPGAQAAQYLDNEGGEADALVIPYADPAAASAALSGFRAELERCATRTTTAGTASYRVLREEPLVHDVITRRAEGAESRLVYGTAATGRYLVAVSTRTAADRVGTLLATAVTHLQVTDPEASPRPEPSVTPSPSATSRAIPEAALPAVADLKRIEPEWDRRDVDATQPLETYGICDGTEAVEAPKRTALLVAGYDSGSAAPSLSAAVSAYADEATARKAVTWLREQVRACPRAETDSDDGTGYTDYALVAAPEAGNGDLVFDVDQRDRSTSKPFVRRVVQHVVGRHVVEVSYHGGDLRRSDAYGDLARRTAGAALRDERYPDESEPTHGGTSWAVYTWVVEGVGDDEATTRERERLRDLGYFGGGGDLDCDRGAREAVAAQAEGVEVRDDAKYISVAVYFANEDAAKRFVAADKANGGPEAVAVASVTTYCLD